MAMPITDLVSSLNVSRAETFPRQKSQKSYLVPRKKIFPPMKPSIIKPNEDMLQLMIPTMTMRTDSTPTDIDKNQRYSISISVSHKSSSRLPEDNTNEMQTPKGSAIKFKFKP